MKLSSRLILIFLFSVSVSLGSFLYWVNSEIRRTYSSLIEQSLVVESQFISGLLAGEQSLPLALENLKEEFDKAESIDFYVTDKQGTVLYHSLDQSEVGQDYSEWNDVYLTLRGSYGARSTRTVKSNPLSSVFYVSAPIMRKKVVVGVVSVFRPELSLNHILQDSKNKILQLLAIVLLVTFLFIFLSFSSISRPFENLKLYMKEIVEKREPKMPSLPKGEFQDLALSIKKMKVSLDEKNKVEAYVQNLVHELKSPLTAINASAEILEDEIESAESRKFAQSIQKQSLRIQQMLDTLLELSRLQNMERIEEVEKIELSELILEVAQEFEDQFRQRGDNLETNGSAGIFASRFLLIQVLRNLFQNIVVHAKSPSQINVKIVEDKDQIVLKVSNTGSEVPDFVLENMFDRYFSYSSNHEKSRGSGLGLNFAYEVMELHQGKISVENLENVLEFTLVFPVKSNI